MQIENNRRVQTIRPGNVKATSAVRTYSHQPTMTTLLRRFEECKLMPMLYANINNKEQQSQLKQQQ